MSRADPRLRKLLQELENPATRQRAVEALVALGATAVGPLARVVREAEHNTSQAAARALAQIGEPAIEVLCHLLSDEDWNVNQSAASALARIGAPAVEPLCRYLGDPDPRAAHLAIAALAKIRKPAADGLCRSLGSRDARAQARAVDALVKMGSPAVPSLTRALREPEKYLPSGAAADRDARCEAIRTQAALALGRIGGSALSVLCSAFGSQDEAVHRSAAWALEQGGDAAVEALCRHLEVAPGEVWRVERGLYSAPVLAALTLGRMGKLRALGPLARALESSSAPLRSAAALGLAELATTTRSPELRAQLPQLRRSQRWKVRGSAEWDALDHAIRTIEQTTAAVANVPVPSAGLGPEKDTLPRPAGPVVSSSDSLPIASDAAGEPSPSEESSWWSRFTRPFSDNP